jgi:hypothetical protein
LSVVFLFRLLFQLAVVVATNCPLLMDQRREPNLMLAFYIRAFRLFFIFEEDKYHMNYFKKNSFFVNFTFVNEAIKTKECPCWPLVNLELLLEALSFYPLRFEYLFY